VASVQLAVLDRLGQVSGRPLGDLLGGVRRRQIAACRASSHRGNAPEEELAYLQKVVEEDGAGAIKFRRRADVVVYSHSGETGASTSLPSHSAHRS
jgi:L-alanine-DL-glutamate epimerase-like enolase superfamily enzyme